MIEGCVGFRLSKKSGPGVAVQGFPRNGGGSLLKE